MKTKTITAILTFLMVVAVAQKNQSIQLHRLQKQAMI